MKFLSLQILKINYGWIKKTRIHSFQYRFYEAFVSPLVLVENQRRETVFPVERPQGGLYVKAKVKIMPTGRWNPSLNEKILSQASCCGFNIGQLFSDFAVFITGISVTYELNSHVVILLLL